MKKERYMSKNEMLDAMKYAWALDMEMNTSTI